MGGGCDSAEAAARRSLPSNKEEELDRLANGKAEPFRKSGRQSRNQDAAPWLKNLETPGRSKGRR
jgi:hypothetical protein